MRSVSLKEFVAVGIPPAGADEYEALLDAGEEKKMRDWTLDFPLHNGVKQVLMGVSPGARVHPPAASR